MKCMALVGRLFGKLRSRNRAGKPIHVIPPQSRRDPLFSQKGQLRFVLEVVFNYAKYGLRRNGYFVDLAAAHPTRLSNTFFLESRLGWDGVLIEANPSFARLLREKRTSKVFECAVTSSNGSLVEFRVDNEELGGIVGDSFDNNRRTRGNELKSAKIISVQTRTLESILDESGAPSVIDYLSLDIEGAEFEAMRDFDFSKYKFKCMTIECPPLELDLLLDAHGYVQVQHSLFDTFYIHKSEIHGACLDNCLPQFLSTPAKDW